MFTVLKPFPHPIRRFAVGATVTEVDLAGCALSVEMLQSGGFIGTEPPPAASAAKRRRA